MVRHSEAWSWQVGSLCNFFSAVLLAQCCAIIPPLHSSSIFVDRLVPIAICSLFTVWQDSFNRDAAVLQRFHYELVSLQGGSLWFLAPRIAVLVIIVSPDLFRPRSLTLDKKGHLPISHQDQSSAWRCRHPTVCNSAGIVGRIAGDCSFPTVLISPLKTAQKAMLFTKSGTTPKFFVMCLYISLVFVVTVSSFWHGIFNCWFLESHPLSSSLWASISARSSTKLSNKSSSCCLVW